MTSENQGWMEGEAREGKRAREGERTEGGVGGGRERGKEGGGEGGREVTEECQVHVRMI
jgi:hypothetical protein